MLRSFIRNLFLKFIPQTRSIVFWDPWNLEVNNVSMAAYLGEHSKYRVYYAVPSKLMGSARKILPNSVKVVSNTDRKAYLQLARSEYLFVSQWDYPKAWSNKAKTINLWHGIPYKKISLLRDDVEVQPYKNDVVVGTSDLTQDIFSKTFGVNKKIVTQTGYPRNDVALNAQKNKKDMKTQLKDYLDGYDKILIWLPTVRKDVISVHGVSGIPVNNVYQINGFDEQKFNEYLKKYNALCIVKPHPLETPYPVGKKLDHILTIDDDWLWSQGITTYDLIGISDLLISDLSSIIIDYMLLDKPIICFSTDWDEYNHTRGFVFEDMEKWLPSKLVQNQSDFIEYLDNLLKTGEDPFEEQRLILKDKFFKYKDAKSASRLKEYLEIN